MLKQIPPANIYTRGCLFAEAVKTGLGCFQPDQYQQGLGQQLVCLVFKLLLQQASCPGQDTCPVLPPVPPTPILCP